MLLVNPKTGDSRKLFLSENDFKTYSAELLIPTQAQQRCEIETFFKKKKLGFTPCKAEQPLRGMELQEKEAQKVLKPLRSHVKGKHSIGTELQGLSVRGKKLLT